MEGSGPKNQKSGAVSGSRKKRAERSAEQEVADDAEPERSGERAEYGSHAWLRARFIVKYKPVVHC